MKRVCRLLSSVLCVRSGMSSTSLSSVSTFFARPLSVNEGESRRKKESASACCASPTSTPTFCATPIAASSADPGLTDDVCAAAWSAAYIAAYSCDRAASSVDSSIGFPSARLASTAVSRSRLPCNRLSMRFPSASGVSLPSALTLRGNSFRLAGAAAAGWPPRCWDAAGLPAKA
eukprot:4166392-Prymnesium_polylepis.1